MKKIKLPRKNVVSFVTTFEGANKVSKLCSEISVKVNVIYKKGFPVIISKIKRRYGLFVGAVIASMLVFVSSLLVWEVRVEGNEYVKSSDIERGLKTCGFYEGCFKNREELEKLYNNYLILEPRISWISINFDGTIAHVEVNETKVIPERVNREKNINIVAANDGVVKRIDVLDGSKTVENGETVTKGQLLISSFVDTRKTGTIMKAARGNVWAQTIHNYTVCVMKNRNIKSELNNKNLYYLDVLGIEVPLHISFFNKYKINDTRINKQPFSIFNKYSLPFEVITENKRLYNIKDTDIDINDALIISEAELEKRILADLMDAEIIKKDCTQSEEKDMYIFEYELVCLENIAKETEFDFIENS